MFKLKNLFGIMITAGLLGLILLIALVTLVDPTQYKDFIQNKITLKTEHPIKLHGPIYWQFDPTLSFELNDIEMYSPKPTDLIEYLTVKKARLKPRFWALFTGKIAFDLDFSEVELDFNPNNPIETGTLNWQSIPKLLSYNLKLNKLSGVWHFDQKSTDYGMKQVQSIVMLDNLPPLNVSGDFTFNKIQTNPMVQGHIKLSNLDLQALAQTFDLGALAPMSTLAQLNTTFKFQESKQEFADFSLTMENGSHMEGSFKINTQANSSEVLSVTGLLHSKHLQLGFLPITDLRIPLNFDKGLWTFNKIEAQVFNSFHHASLEIDQKNLIPTFSLSDQFESDEINDFLATLGRENQIHGKLTANTALQAQGSNFTDFLNSLSGTAHITLTDGKIHGIELFPLLQHAQATTSKLIDGLSHGQPVNIAVVLEAELEQWKKQASNEQALATVFRSAETHLMIENGKLFSKDFKLIHPNYTIDGHGTLDFIHHKLDYEAHAWLNRTGTHPSQLVERFFKETPLSIKIYGPTNNLAIFPDLNLYTHNAVNLIKEPTDMHSHSFEQPNHSLEKQTNPLEKLFGFP